MRAIRVHEPGDPDVMAPEDVERPVPGAGQALVGIDAAGVNMIDVQQRSGNYAVPMPFTPGTEGAGEVLEVGPDAGEMRPGDRVAFAMVPGSYAEAALVPADRLVPLPPAIGSETAAAVLLQGMTAHFLVESIAPLQAGDVVVVHAAAGGVGLLLTQLAAARGLIVVGTTSTRQKAELVSGAGATDVVIRGTRELPEVVRSHGDGRGARIVFDSIARDTFEDSLASLARRGTLVVFGQSSGPVPPFDIRRLQGPGSVFLTRPGLGDYTATRDELLWRAGEVFAMVAAGDLEVRVQERFPLERAPDAHRALASGTTSGKLLLVTGR
ncbi:MAG TPA: quinone oxidoreductase [Actinomycetota bacterium]|jgi:NADPH2:quinone reductase|nr:quinone oxidoreductase [Actinomycetota bacterium]